MANIRSDKYNDQTQQFTQTLAVDGKVVSSRSDKIGKGGRFNTAVEGQGAFSGTIYSHSRFQMLRNLAGYWHEQRTKIIRSDLLPLIKDFRHLFGRERVLRHPLQFHRMEVKPGGLIKLLFLTTKRVKHQVRAKSEIKLVSRFREDLELEDFFCHLKFLQFFHILCSLTSVLYPRYIVREIQ